MTPAEALPYSVEFGPRNTSTRATASKSIGSSRVWPSTSVNGIPSIKTRMLRTPNVERTPLPRIRETDIVGAEPPLRLHARRVTQGFIHARRRTSLENLFLLDHRDRRRHLRDRLGRSGGRHSNGVHLHQRRFPLRTTDFRSTPLIR
ncbi:MAG: hypothetical protein KatS3mg082_1239 [Nitrospiraceae bacterium]|nr:MAG: hypothetical protein KatS3mg082_1239 [Nitrospiraceae bacterium]